MRTVECNLRQIRLANGWSIKELSQKTGITVSVLKWIEQGQEPRLSAMVAIANVCACDFDIIWPDAKRIERTESEEITLTRNLDPRTRERIINSRRQGTRVWKISQEMLLPEAVVRIVLFINGEKLCQLNNRREKAPVPSSRRRNTHVRIREPKPKKKKSQDSVSAIIKG